MPKQVLIFLLLLLPFNFSVVAQLPDTVIPEATMQSVYRQVSTPYKYGLVVVPENNSKKLDCPTVFRKNNRWYMSYIVFDGRGYETWLAKSKDLLHWTTLGKILSFSDTTAWDGNQRAGYIALTDYQWGGSYEVQQYKNKYWLSYLGGAGHGYEEGLLSIGLANTAADIATPHEWRRFDKPVLMSTDKDCRWWENNTLFKSTIIWDKNKLTGYPFVMYYNARGDSMGKQAGAERIGMAVSKDMEHWMRYGKEPVLDHHTGITGDAVIQKIDSTWVMFYFGAFWKNKDGAFNRFACSNDLVHWTDWNGSDLVAPSEPYDELYAHKAFVVKHKGIVYHFYCAVNKAEQRGIAVATSKSLGKSSLRFGSK